MHEAYLHKNLELNWIGGREVLGYHAISEYGTKCVRMCATMRPNICLVIIRRVQYIEATLPTCNVRISWLFLIYAYITVPHAVSPIT